MQLARLLDMFVHDLEDVYSAEKQILRALPKMIEATTSAELGAALEEHRQITEHHVARLDQILDSLDHGSRGDQLCKGMAGLIAEGAERLEHEADAAARDALIIGVSQKVEHYEIAAYGTLLAYANLLNQDRAASLIEETLNDEMEADERLTEISMSIVNVSAPDAHETPPQSHTGNVRRP